MELELEKVNLILSDLKDGKKEYLDFVEKQKGYMGVSGNSYSDDGVQGEYDQYFNIYKIKSETDLFLKVEYNTDSYGSNDSIVGVQFVKPKEVKVTDYESIK